MNDDEKLEKVMKSIIEPFINRDPEFMKKLDPEFVNALDSEDFDYHYWNNKFMHKEKMSKILKLIKTKK